MKFFILLALVAVALSSSTEKVKAGRRSSVFNLPANAKVRAEDVEQFLRLQNDYDDVDVEPVAGELRQTAPVEAQVTALPADALKGDSANGRMFLKKLLLFSNFWGGSSNTQPIIPIIITGTGTTNSGTITTTGTITGTGTITTSPQYRARDSENEDYLIGEEDVIDESAGNSKATRRQNLIKLKQGKGNQQLGFVVPQKYMRYFQNNANAVVVNPAVYNNGANKLRKVRLNNNGNIKRKRSRAPAVRRFVPSQ